MFLSNVFLVFRLLLEELSDKKRIKVSSKLPTACLDKVLFNLV